MPLSGTGYLPIIDVRDIERLRVLLAAKPRDLLLFELAIQTGVLMKHLLLTKARHLDGVMPGELLRFPEQFGERAQKAVMSRQLLAAFDSYRAKFEPGRDDLLFQSRKGGSALMLTSASAIINGWYKEVGLEGLSGASSLRKTYEYHNSLRGKAGFRDKKEARKPDSVLRPVKASTLQEMVYDQLLNAIVSGKLPPGEQIVIDKVAESMLVSPMPVRDALARLAAASVVTTNRKRRFIVNELSPSDWAEVQDIRLSLESKAAKAACLRSTPELVARMEEIHKLYCQQETFRNANVAIDINRKFHYAIYEHSNKPILLQFIRNLWDRASPYLHLMYEEQSRHSYDIHKLSNDHLHIIAGMRERNVEKVVMHLKSDLRFGMALVEQLIMPK